MTKEQRKIYNKAYRLAHKNEKRDYHYCLFYWYQNGKLDYYEYYYNCINKIRFEGKRK